MNTAKRTAAHTALDAYLDTMTSAGAADRDPVMVAIELAAIEARKNAKEGSSMPLTAISNKKVVDFVPARPCRDTLYSPFYFRDPDTGREFVYTMGGRIDNAPFDDGTPGPPKFVDKIFVSVRIGEFAENPGTWSSPKLCIGPDTFPWMVDYVKQQANHPPWYVASASSPSVFKIEGTFYMLFTASVDDANLSTGEHNTPALQKPWAHFVVYLAISDDGIKWTLASTGRGHENPAIAAAQIYHIPTAEDIAAFTRAENPHEYKGISSLSALVDDGYVYAMLGCWMTSGQKNGLVRCKVGGDAWEINTVNANVPEKWRTLVNGELPDWFVNLPAKPDDIINGGNPYPLLVSCIAKTTLPASRFTSVPQPAPLKFVLVYDAPGFQFGKKPDGVANCIAIDATNDLSDWPNGARMIEGDIKTINGFGTNNVVHNSTYFERDGKAFILFATNDHDGDGKPDCTEDYFGLAIHELELA